MIATRRRKASEKRMSPARRCSPGALEDRLSPVLAAENRPLTPAPEGDGLDVVLAPVDLLPVHGVARQQDAALPVGAEEEPAPVSDRQGGALVPRPLPGQAVGRRVGGAGADGDEVVLG